jgi:hypothetical protein
MLLPLLLVTACDRPFQLRVVTKTPPPPPGTATEMVPSATVAPTEVATEAATPTVTPEPASPTAEPPTATPEPPTPTSQTPAPSATPEPARIRFEPGTTSATISEQIEQLGIHRYVLGASAGQLMDILLTSRDDDVLTTIYGADGTVLKSHTDGLSSWRGTLPSTQDYVIEVVSIGEATTYYLSVTIPARIEFEAETTSMTISSHIAEHGTHDYVVRAFAGQIMEVAISSPNEDVLPTVYGADGTVLKRYVDGATEWQGELPATQDYIIMASSFGGETDYTLLVEISALGLPEPSRVEFAPGATSATLEGTLAAGEYHRYVLRAQEGQRMEVYASPGEAMDISVVGADGSFWSAETPESTLIIEALPVTQDYIITLSVVPGKDPVNYRMDVVIPPP